MAASETATSKRPDHEKAPPTGYTLVLPPGWSRIPLRHGTEQAITKILDRAFAGLPRDQVASLRRGLQLRLRDLAERAREGSGLDLYLPTERMGEVTATASFVVAEMSLVSAEPVDPSMLVARLVADSEHTAVVEVAGSAGTRTEHVAAAEPEQGVEYASRRLDYVLPVPAEKDRWVVISFSTLGTGDPTDEFAQLLVELFDAIMTFRWRQP
jgi:hypothetical protein